MLRITVVTPCYNMGKYLERTIQSVLQNLEPGDEYFIIDGGSTDDSVKIIEAFRSKITGWVSEKDHGYADALAKGFNRGTGDVFCWINASDILLPGAFEKVRNVFTKTNVDFIFGDDFYISEDDKILAFSKGQVGNLRSAMLYGGWTPLQDACFWTKNLYQKVGGIDVSLKYAADFDLFLRFSLSGKTQYVPHIFSAFRRHGDQKSISGSAEYRKERIESLSMIKTKERIPLIKFYVLKAYYWFYVRFRARVLTKLWDKNIYKGKFIKEINI